MDAISWERALDELDALGLPLVTGRADRPSRSRVAGPMPRLVTILVASVLASNCLACGGGASASRGVETSEDGPRYAQPDLFGNCPSGTHRDDCAHGSCEHCDDCVAECVFD